MKFPIWIPLGVMAVAICTPSATASADDASAYCEVRKDGETKQGRSGPCDFSQRQGYVNIDLKNGETWELTPTDAPQQFRDQKGNKVVRTASGDRHEYKWDHKKIIVTFGGGEAAPAAGAGGKPDSFETVCGVMVEGKDSAYRCQVTDHFAGGQKTHTTLRFPDQTIELTWHPGNRVGLQFEGMVPKEARYSTSEGETNWVFEGKTYYYFSDKGRASYEVQNLRN